MDVQMDLLGLKRPDGVTMKIAEERSKKRKPRSETYGWKLDYSLVNSYVTIRTKTRTCTKKLCLHCCPLRYQNEDGGLRAPRSHKTKGKWAIHTWRLSSNKVFDIQSITWKPTSSTWARGNKVYINSFFLQRTWRFERIWRRKLDKPIVFSFFVGRSLWSRNYIV